MRAIFAEGVNERQMLEGGGSVKDPGRVTNCLMSLQMRRGFKEEHPEVRISRDGPSVGGRVETEVECGIIL